jgi:hypothetical protein
VVTFSRNELPQRDARHVFLCYLASLLPLRARQTTFFDFLQAATQGEYDVRIRITFIRALTASFLHITYLLLQSASHVYRHKAVIRGSRSPSLYVPSITGTPVVAFTIQKLDQPTGSAHVYNTALLLIVIERIGFNPGIFSLTFFSFLTQWCAFSALGDRSVEPSSTRTRSISPASGHLRQPLFPLVLSLSSLPG